MNMIFRSQIDIWKKFVHFLIGDWGTLLPEMFYLQNLQKYENILYNLICTHLICSISTNLKILLKITANFVQISPYFAHNSKNAVFNV